MAFGLAAVRKPRSICQIGLTAVIRLAAARSNFELIISGRDGPELTLVRHAANGRCEPLLPDAALCADARFSRGGQKRAKIKQSFAKGMFIGFSMISDVTIKVSKTTVLTRIAEGAALLR